MSVNARRILNSIRDADHALNDPGPGGCIEPFGDLQICELVTTQAESRTLADPTKAGIRFTLRMKTDGGDCTVTTTNGLDVDGNTQAVFADVGDQLELISVSAATGFRWEILVNTGSVALSGGVAASLPSGAVGAWYASDYQATPRRVIPNSISSAEVSQNLFAAPRRLFNNTIYYAKTAATVTDDADVGPDGVSGEASTVVGSSSSWLLRIATGFGNIPAGTYTLACWVKRNTGTDQTFCFSKDNTITRSGIQTATGSWQRFTYTFTLASTTGSQQFSICNDGSTTASIQICDFELFAGSSDLGQSNGTSPAGHFYLGNNHYATQPAVASNELDLANQGWGQIQLPSNLSLSNGFTHVTLIKKTAAGSAYHATLSKCQNFNDFTMMTELSKAVCNFLGVAVRNYNGENLAGAIVGMWELLNQGYHVHTVRYDGTNTDWWLDDCLLHRKAGAITDKTFRDFHVGIVNSISLYAGNKMHSMALWDRALTDEEILDSLSYAQSRATTDSLTATNQERVICFEGDSISGMAGTCWPYYYGTNLASPAFLGHNFAISGSTIASMTSRAATVDAVLPPVANRSGRKFILCVLIGANDLLSLGATTWLANLKTYLQARRSAGWTVIVGTPTPRTAAGFNTQRAIAVTEMRTWGTADGVDYKIDYAASTTYGEDAHASDVAKFGDGTHPTTTTQQNMATDAAPVINAA